MKLNKSILLLSIITMTNLYANDVQAKSLKKAPIQNSSSIIKNAEEIIDEGKYEDAITLLKKIPVKDKLSSKKSLLLGKLYITSFGTNLALVRDDMESDIEDLKTDLNNAAWELKKVDIKEKELKQNLYLLNLMYGAYYQESAKRNMYFGDYEDAIRNFNFAEKYMKDEITIFTDRAIAYAKSGDFVNALKNEDVAFNDNPHSFNANYSMARVYAIMNDNKSAILSLKKSIIQNEELKEKAIEEEDFESISSSEEFKKLVK